MLFKKKTILFLLLLVLVGSVDALAAKKDQFPISPQLNNGKKWQIGYYEGGIYSSYCQYLLSLTKGLMELGWVKKQEFYNGKSESTEEIWRWLSTQLESDYIEFRKDAYYSAHWDKERRLRLKETVTERLSKKKNIDLMIAMGTWAGEDLATGKHNTPIMVMSCSDPVGSGIIKSVEDSGMDHVHARVDPLRYERQVRLFHEIIGFKTLGVAYEDSVYGRSYAAIDSVEKVAAERGFEIKHCFTQSDISDKKLAGESVVRCFNSLSQEVDAIYVTVQGGVNSETLPRLIRIANERKIPTFAQSGTNEVRDGLLMSISRAGFRPVGRYLAATMAQIFNGAKPRQLGQVFEDSPNIAVNLKTAEVIGLYLYADVLAAADEIYHEMEGLK